MKKLFLTVALITAAAISIAIVSCKKDNENIQKTPQQTEATVLVNRIKDFCSLRDAVHSGVKDNGTMAVNEMRQILDLTTNYEHSQHRTYCVNKILDTLHIAMPAVDAEGRVNNTDVVETYDAFETMLEKRMLEVKDGLNVPSYFSIVLPTQNAKSEGEINVVFLRGEADETSGDEDHTSDGPFVEGDDWIWGLDLGPCDPTGYTGRMIDAADKLTQCFRFTPDLQHQGQSYIIANVEHAKYAPTDYVMPDDIIYYEDPNMEDCAPTWLFLYVEFVESIALEPCIPFDEMNCYWRSIRRNITLPEAPLHYGPSTNSPYHECVIDDRLDLRHTRRMHVANVVYCDVLWSEPNLPPID